MLKAKFRPRDVMVLHCRIGGMESESLPRMVSDLGASALSSRTCSVGDGAPSHCHYAEVLDMSDAATFSLETVSCEHVYARQISLI